MIKSFIISIAMLTTITTVAHSKCYNSEEVINMADRLAFSVKGKVISIDSEDSYDYGRLIYSIMGRENINIPGDTQKLLIVQPNIYLDDDYIVMFALTDANTVSVKNIKGLMCPGDIILIKGKLLRTINNIRRFVFDDIIP